MKMKQMDPVRQLGILLVEDVDEMRSMLECLIEKLDGVILTGSARNVVEAQLELERRRPDCIFLDEILPGESSLDLVAQADAEQIPVFFITSMEERCEAVPPGVLKRILKPTWRTFGSDIARFNEVLCQLRKIRS